jgi:hypothetical protein
VVFPCYSGTFSNRMVFGIVNHANAGYIQYTYRTCSVFPQSSKYDICHRALGDSCFALLLPFTPLAAIFGFVAPPRPFYLALVGIVGTYILLVELTKRWFYKRYDI